ncbi:MAG: hypothetical protein ABSE73_07030 [Planctomycetota bacterium]
MAHTLRIDVSDKLYAALTRRAAAAGQAVEKVALADLRGQAVASPGKAKPGKAEGRRRKGLAKWIGAWRSGDPDSADNARIDADLAKEYGRGLDGDAP